MPLLGSSSTFGDVVKNMFYIFTLFTSLLVYEQVKNGYIYSLIG